MFTVSFTNETGELFDGPLDYLLHLIKQNEMDLVNLDLTLITDQYLAYIHNSVENLHLEVASEYLVMAAYLIETKSKMLLPKERVELEDEYQEDPRDQLIRRLIEYKKYKDVLDEFRNNREERTKYFTKIPNNLVEYHIDQSNRIPNDLEVYDLVRAMQKMFQRKVLLEPMQTAIAKKEYSVENRVEEIKNFFKFKNTKRIIFDELFDIPDKDYFIVTFMAVLDLVKNRYLIIEQINNFDEIYLEVK